VTPDSNGSWARTEIGVSDIAYVVLSDLHFGAANSILSQLQDGSRRDVRDVDPATTSPVLSSLVETLRQLLAEGEGEPPTLVLAGDVLDLALSQDEVAAAVFEQFVSAMFASGRPMFSPRVLYVPGNHDHHMWESAREVQYADFLRIQPRGELPAAPWHATRMRADHDPRPVRSPLLSALCARATDARVEIQVVYPNLVLTKGHRAVAIHHGHYVESLYTLMSQLRDLLFPGQADILTAPAWQWEAENFAWIDFFWGTMGRSGGVGRDIGLIYAQLSSPDCLHHYIRNAVDGLIGHSKAPTFLKRPEEAVVRTAIDWIVDRHSHLERLQTDVDLTPAAEEGLRRYVNGPLLRQMAAEARTEFPELLPSDAADLPADTTFIFGHTHKPFVRSIPLGAGARALPVHNTGGWVVDKAIPSLVNGASAVLVSADLDVASLQLFKQTSDGSPSPITIEGQSTWSDELRAKHTFDGPAWQDLATHVATSVSERYELVTALQKMR
jgi:UDP-2,3-diacylglucosamine pyrophosphatase LpxH